MAAAALTLAAPSGAVGPCDPPVTNPVACENTQPGNPQSEWDVAGAGDADIQGFATDISVDQGETVRFKVDTPATDYRLDIYRLGYYGGDGARKVATVQPSAVLPQAQPACLSESATGLTDCGNWAESASWDVPADAVSGIYFAKLVREDAAGASHVVFVVRDDDGGSDLLFQTGDTTWQAYNAYGGNSLYTGSPAGRAYKVSYNRPFTSRGATPEDWVFNAEYPMVRFLEANGYDVSYFTGVDSDRRGSEILEHGAFLSVGHDEYWSGAQRANVEAARAAGVHLAFFSGNEVFWKTRWESSIDGSGTAHRTLVSYKETHANAKIDPLPNVWTGTWRDPRSFNPEGPNPENALTGQIFTVNCCTYAIEVPAAEGRMRFWRNTSVATLSPESSATLSAGTLGYEWDEDLDNGSRPSGLVRMSSTTVNVPQRILDHGSTYGPAPATHRLTLYRHASGALVFGAGTVQWSWGLDGNHDRGGSTPDPRMQQATVNLFADMGAQPDTLQGGLVPAAASADALAPSADITSPAAGAQLDSGAQVTISGTAADAGGGEVGGVEVSVDGGATWHPATGRSSWTYSWTPGATGATTIRARAVDDSGNLETTGDSVAVDVVPRTCPCSVWSDSVTPPVSTDSQAVELGVKFRSEVDGFITALRFYKGAANTGTHVGHLWQADGTLLADVTFTGESASGWQQMQLSSPVAVSADTTYVASYHAPNGNYAFSPGYYSSSGADSPPLHALQNGVDGPNGVYRYGPSGGFPTDTFNASNYWVDVVFNETATDDTPPTITSVSPPSNSSGTSTGANVTATFSEAMNAGTISGSSFELRDSSNTVVPADVSYSAAARRATLDPSGALANSTTYTATVKGGAGGVADSAGNALASDFSWSFTTAAPPPPPPDEGPGGPVLVIGSASNPFSRYYAEILRAEGLNAFTVTDLSTVTPATLAAHDVVILGETALSAAEVTMLSDWVDGGGNLIAMRPDTQLADLLGLSDTATTLSNAYLQVDTAAGTPGAGIVGDTIQFHGAADRYTLNGASAIATLYSDASTATSSPAVTLRGVGTNGGQVAAFTYDLARSVVYTRQGNPAWAGQERDGTAPMRSDDLFYGGAAFDPQPDWVDLSKVAIPQADEQQRLLVNLIGQMNLDRKPLPRFWYLPRSEEAAVVMTGDDHANGGTAPRFDTYKAQSPPGCAVAQWECVRASSYVYENTPLSAAQATSYEADGFEVALHVNTNCGDWTPSSLDQFYDDQLAAFAAKYSGTPAPSTNRTHCIAWSDWATQPQVELDHGIRLDTNYYYWPPAWVQNRPGLFTGSGMPMRFADLDGAMIDVYQATTQMTDESGQSYPFTSDALLDRAIGAEGYYGVFTANMHTDSSSHPGSDAIVASAQARDVPVVSARQMLEWLDGRNGSSFGSISWSADKLSFTIDVGAGANGLRAMVPMQSAAGQLTGVKRNGTSIATTTRTIKGVEYAFFEATAGNYEAAYAVDATPPAISGVAAAPGTGSTATVTWTTDEPSDSRVDYGTSPETLGSSATESALVTSHSIELTGLAPGTTYHYRVTSADAGANSATSPPAADPPATFTTPSASFTDTTVADFSAGTPGTNAYVAESANGEVILSPAVGAEFSGASLPLGWSVTPWNAGGGATVSGGQLTVDEARAGTDQTYGSGRSLEFVATFGGGINQHVGFGQTFNELVWAMFSIKNDGTFYARTANGAGTTDTPLPSALLGSPHRYRVDWNAGSVEFFVDGALVATHTTSFGATEMRPLVSDLNNNLGPGVSVDWMRMSPYPASATFDSRVFDAGESADWGALSWSADTPAGTGITLSVRTGNTSTPDASWSAFTPIATSGGDIPGNSRYVQYRAELTSTDPGATPVLRDVTIAFSAGADVTPPTIADRSPAPNASEISPDTNVTVQFSEPMNPATIGGSTLRLRAQGASVDVPATVSYSGLTATLDPTDPLAPNKQYQVTVAGSVEDANGNSLGADDSWSFTTAPVTLGLIDTTSAEFGAGTTGADTYVSETGDGEVSLAPTVGAEFSGVTLPSGWSAFPWAAGGAATVAAGRLTVDGARVGTDATFSAGRSLEYVATFAPTTFQHIGFGNDFNDQPWAIFSTKADGSFNARTNNGSSAIDTPLPSSLLGSSHRYRIEWNAGTVEFFVDGTLVATHAVSFGAAEMRPLASDGAVGGPALEIEWLRMSPYPASGTFLSRVFDAGQQTDWRALSWTADTPAGTSVSLSVRTGDTSTPDASWSAFTPVAASGDDIPGSSRYVQYRAELQTSDADLTPILSEVAITHADTVAPTVAVDSVSDTLLGAADASTDVTWHADQNGTYSVRVGGSDCASGTEVASGAYDDAPGQRTTTVQASDLAEGDNTIRVCVTDAGNNTGSATTQVTKDTVAPTVAVDSVSDTLLGAADASTDVTWHADQNGTYSVRVGGSDCASGTEVASGAYDDAPGQRTTTVQASDLAEGDNSVRICVTDAAGNTDSATTTVTKDTIAPTVTIDSVSNPLLGPSDASTDVTWHADQNGTYSVRVGGSDCASGTEVASGAYDDAPGQRTTTVQASDLAEGDNTIRVCVTDAAGNTDSAATTVTKATGYPRPKAASPLKTSLVPAYEECTSPNRIHGPPLDSSSCNPPAQRSSHLTVGSPDANSRGANMTGHARFATVVGDPGTPADEADVNITVSVTDVRDRTTLADYTGELQARTVLRTTDTLNGATGNDSATVTDTPYEFTVPCAATGTAANVGATCSLSTTADALVPGAVTEGKRAIWQLGDILVLDGGPDGDAETSNNTVFLRQGIFVP